MTQKDGFPWGNTWSFLSALATILIIPTLWWGFETYKQEGRTASAEVARLHSNVKQIFHGLPRNIKIGQMYEADLLIDQLNRLDPNNEKIKLYEAWSFYAKIYYKGAIEKSQEYLKDYPNDVDGIFTLYRAKYDYGEQFEVEKLIQDVIKASPYFIPAHRDLAALYGNRGGHEEARKKYNEILKFAPGEPISLEYLGMTYAMTGDDAMALKYFEQAYEQYMIQGKIVASINYKIAIALNKIGRKSDAVKILKSSILSGVFHDEPDLSRNAYCLLVNLLIDLGKPKEAYESANEGLLYHVNNEELLALRSNIFAMKGDETD